MRIFKLTLSGLILLIAFGAKAGSFQISAQSIKALGMGGSLSGHAFDAGTVFFNPGGMTALKDKTVFNAGISALMQRSSFLGTENQTAEDDGGLSLPFHIYVSTKLKNERLSVGLSVNTPFGYLSNWKDDWTGRFISQTFRIRTIYFQPTAAYKLNDNLSLGAGPVLATGSIYSTRALPYTTSDGKESSMELNGSGTAVGANIGFYYAKNKLTLGLTWRSGVNMKIKDGEAEFNDIPTSLLQNGTYPTGTSFDSELNIPSVYSIAGGYILNDRVILTLGFNFIQWSVFESLDYDFADPTLTDIRTVRNYDNTLSFRAGIEAKAFPKITLRGGLALDKSPVLDNYMSPDIPDDDKVIISAGLSWKIKDNFSFDGSFMLENVREHRESDNLPYNFNGTYNSFIYNVGIGAQFIF
jgi:long-chain fatty acid transport protein